MYENRIFLENPWKKEIEYREYREQSVETEHYQNENRQFNGQREINNQIRNLVRNFLESCD